MNNVEKARKYGVAWANQMFKDFSNPNNRGENFTWEKFPDMASRLAEAGCFMNFSHRVKNLTVLEEACRRSCKERCEFLVKRMIKVN